MKEEKYKFDKTLVIHPEDPTTGFLDAIYKNRGWTVINNKININEMRDLIKENDYIIMLGHGTPDGLLGFDDYAITHLHAPLLKDKHCVCIWCNSDHFVKLHNLKGFYTGMIISEYYEAEFCKVPAKKGDVELSNKIFTKSVANWFDDINRVEKIKNEYNENIPVFNFNRVRLYDNISNQSSDRYVRKVIL